MTKTRPARKIRKPVRYQSNISDYGGSTSETDTSYYKIKRILAQRKRKKPEYLVHFKGEPAQNAVYLTFDQLNAQAQKSVVDCPQLNVDEYNIPFS